MEVREKAAASLASAKEALLDQNVNPFAFGLVNLTSHRNTYPKEKMVETLLVLEQRRGGAEFNLEARKKQLLSMQAVPLRQKLVIAFYGEEYEYVPKKTMVPQNGTPERQLLGVDFAKKNGWVQKKAVAL